MMGALFGYISSAGAEDFQPMKPNFGLLPPLGDRVRAKKRRYQAYAQRALQDMEAYVVEVELEHTSEVA
jgi:methylenetetrahydrofolate--tRNA-(uracil-5-)-methyltransferase